LGQNFLIDKGAVKKIIRAAELQNTDTVLEIGPGQGALTLDLAKKVKKVIACEKDKRLCQILKEKLKDFKNIEIINEDILKLDLKPEIQNSNFKIVANLPFSIANRIIKKFLETDNVPEKMILMVQKEVGKRICAKPPKTNFLAISVQFFANPKIVFYVSKNSFLPKPKVDAAVLKIIPYRSYSTFPKQFIKNFFKIVRAGFSQPRKQLANNLSKMLKLKKEKVKEIILNSNIDFKKRPENLEIKDWIKLTEAMEKFI